MEFKPPPRFHLSTAQRDDELSRASRGADPFEVTPSSALHAKLHPMSTAKSRSNSSSSGSRGGGVSLASRKMTMMEQQVPSTPGRPLFFSGSPAHPARRPSKWEDAERWLMSNGNGSCHEKDPKKCASKTDRKHKDCASLAKNGVICEERRLCDGAFEYQDSNVATCAGNADVYLKDKFTDTTATAFPNPRSTGPAEEGFLFGHSCCEMTKVVANEAVDEAHQRDVGTEMTPLGSSTTSRCHTPMKSTSPLRHNTPTGCSGTLTHYNANGLDISELKDRHFARFELAAKFDSMLISWKSKQEEEEEVSKSLRHFEESFCDKESIAECRVSAWEEEERTKSCIRYQREEAKIQAWVNLENAKSEAQSRKLEVKIQKMRSHLEERLMRRMANVHKKAEEWRADARMQHMQQLKRSAENTSKPKRSSLSQALSGGNSQCGCLPCSSSVISSSRFL